MPYISSLLDYGAVGDGVTDDTAAVNAAFAAGVPLTGLRKNYAVSGNISMPDNLWLEDAAFKQLSPNNALRRTLVKSPGSGRLTLKRVTVDRNGATTDGTIADAAGIWISGTNDVYLEDVEVFGNSKGTGIFIVDAQRTKLVRPYVHDMRWSAAENPGGEQIVGIFFVRCTDVDIDTPRVRNLDGVVGAGAPRAFQTDGLTFSDCREVRIFGGSLQNVGEGMDITGSGGNARFMISTVEAIDCDAFGFKVANSGSEIQFVNCIARTCGYSGFVVSGAVAAGLNNCEDITFIGCRSISTGSNGQWSAFSVAGFAILQGSFDTQFPANVRFVECEAIDEQSPATMKYGFRNEVPPSASNIRTNRMIGCEVVGASVSNTLQFIGDYWCSLNRSTDFSVPNNSSTTLAWNSELDDPYGLHASNASAITVREAGLYEISCQVEFESASAGFRALTLLIGGGATSVRSLSPGSSATPTTVAIHTLRQLAKDASIEVQLYQNSGAALNARAQLCRMEVRKVYGAL